MWPWTRHPKTGDRHSDQVAEARDALADADAVVRQSQRVTREIIDPAMLRLRRVAQDNNFEAAITRALGGN